MKKLLLIQTLLLLFSVLRGQLTIQLPASAEGASNNYIIKGTGDGGNLHTSDFIQVLQ